MRYVLIKVSMLFIAAACLGGCYAEAYAVAPGPMVVESYPPEGAVYVEAAACPVDYVYVADYYHWDGYGWVLIEGGCYYRPGYIWIAPTYVHVHSGVHYSPGYWKPTYHGHVNASASTAVVQGHPPPKKVTAHPPSAPPPPPALKAHPPGKAIPK